ncbi:response regulator [Kiloniella sp. b19]|uniref:response regulator n=1 Tax=Kiloniella sp. GXU_MW_B19 TaxID=3141326 RepID=UPI0031D63DEF
MTKASTTAKKLQAHARRLKLEVQGKTGTPQPEQAFWGERDWAHLRVDVVDDSSTVRSMLVLMLKSVGIEQVRAFSCVDDAWEAALEKRPHVVLCDYNMSPHCGDILLQRFRQSTNGLYRNVVFLMMSGDPVMSREMLTDCLPVELSNDNRQGVSFDLGIDDFLPKPLERQFIRPRFEQACLRRRGEDFRPV